MQLPYSNVKKWNHLKECEHHIWLFEAYIVKLRERHLQRLKLRVALFSCVNSNCVNLPSNFQRCSLKTEPSKTKDYEYRPSI